MFTRLLLVVLVSVCQHVYAGQPERFGFGRTPSATEIKQWDTDITPAGRQLPPGSGSVDNGGMIYSARCQSCHGEAGKGGPNDRLAGSFDPRLNFAKDMQAVRTIGNYWPYATTLYDYINRAMPFTAPGSLSADEVYSLVAYLLYLNGIISEDTVIDARNLPQVVMPAKQLFYWSNEVK